MQPKHFLSVDDFSDADYRRILADAAIVKTQWKNYGDKIFKSGQGRIVSLLFNEPSTRTSMSFDKAAKKIGASAIGLNVASSSIAKGESLQDTVTMAAMGSDVLVVRHGGENGTLRDTADNVLSRYEETAGVALINGGEGKGEHPTQALLDLFTIEEQFGRTDVRIGFYGDLARGRTCHSLIKLGARFGMTFSCVAPTPDMQMPQEYLQDPRHAARPYCTYDINEVLPDLDVLYTVRLQRERGQDELHHPPSETLSGYGVTKDILARLPQNSIVMHPLPRLDEMPPQLDADLRLKHVTQAYNGIITRVALLRHCLGGG